MGAVIVSRHPAAVEFIKSTANIPEDTPVLPSVSIDDVKGKIVFGNLPFHLACHASVVYAVEFTGVAPRGAEYTLADMVNAGARLRAYKVEEVQ